MLGVEAEVLIRNSSFSLYPQAICQHFLLTLLLNISLNHGLLSITLSPPRSDPHHLLSGPLHWSSNLSPCSLMITFYQAARIVSLFIISPN